MGKVSQMGKVCGMGKVCQWSRVCNRLRMSPDPPGHPHLRPPLVYMSTHFIVGKFPRGVFPWGVGGAYAVFGLDRRSIARFGVLVKLFLVSRNCVAVGVGVEPTNPEGFYV